MQLFLLPYAGGNRYSYNFLKDKIKSHGIQPHVLELPGRGRRYDEPVILNFEDAIKDYLRQIKLIRNGKRYLIYGHSMGAILGFYICQRMEKQGDSPFLFIASGSPGPLPLNSSDLYGPLSDRELKIKLQKLGGTSNEILENPEVFQFFKTYIKADFTVLDDEINMTEPLSPINIPIMALMGTREEEVEKITNWKRLTTKSFSYNIFRGNHFFIYDYPDRIIRILIQKSKSFKLNVLNAISKS